MNVEITRIGEGPSGTFGALKIEGEYVCLTLERPWEDNKPNVSCIPIGTYICKRVDSPRYGDVFEVNCVPGRSHILFHKGNTINDTKGCILLGSQIGSILNTDGNKIWGVEYSSEAFAAFNAKLRSVDEFTLTIREAV